ncbi:hypothetical protein [Sediminibacillus albus]|uniref:Uncharacterized protein n=1 Tax=Sediminibacillus albus TaxID=407036 RepID=A0A1G8YWB9_9BACI|nr:hypothetical protein [Sediminibacillus albus]SDK07152.1 hypothetical protein SAMN05216243_1869 [Sediminibacillus albus]
MNGHILDDWKLRLESRKDLLFLYQDKDLDVKMVLNGHPFWLLFRSGQIQILPYQQYQGSLMLQVELSREITPEVMSGEQKLTSYPSNLVSWQGRYRDCLLLESLLFLP